MMQGISLCDHVTEREPRQTSEVDKRCIYASSEHLKMINSFISYGITEDNLSSLMIVLWDGVAKKAKALFSNASASV